MLYLEEMFTQRDKVMMYIFSCLTKYLLVVVYP